MASYMERYVWVASYCRACGVQVACKMLAVQAPRLVSKGVPICRDCDPQSEWVVAKKVRRA